MLLALFYRLRTQGLGYLRNLLKVIKLEDDGGQNLNVNSVLLQLHYREGGQFLSLPLYFSSTSYFGHLLHTHCRRWEVIQINVHCYHFRNTLLFNHLEASPAD